MKNLKAISILLLLLVSTVSCAQNQKMKTEVDKIKELGKDSIIQLAMDITSFRFEKSNFEKITITANHEDVYVSFNNPVKYIPLYMDYLTDLHVSIVNKTINYNIIANPIDGVSTASAQPRFYIPNKKAIQFVFDAINKSKEIGNASSDSEGFEELNMTIKEKETYYDVSDASGTQESNYKVKKETGEIYDVVHYSLEIDPDADAEDNEKTVDLTNYFIDQINANACVTKDVLKNTFKNIYDNIQNNSKPVHNGELGSTMSGYASNNIRFSHLKYLDKFPEIISIYDSNEAITYYLFKNKDESFNMYYERHFSPQLFDEQKYKGIVAHFCKNIVNKDFTKSDSPSEITYQTLSKMDRDGLISLAKSKIDTHQKLVKEKPFNYSGINTKVLKNSTTFIVYFEQSFKYVPLHSGHYYGFYVNLLHGDIDKLDRANGIDPVIEVNGGFDYYVPSSQDLEKIAFVKKAISYKHGHNVVVYEKEKHYELGYETSGEKVDKKTGKVFDFWDRIYAPEEDPLVEVLANPCPTQEDFKQVFTHLKKEILKKGKKHKYEGDDYPSTVYTYNDIGFSYRNIATKKYPKEIIHVTGSGSYWIIKSEGTYAINIKDFHAKIAKQKRKEALEHFCTHLLNFKE